MDPRVVESRNITLLFVKKHAINELWLTMINQNLGLFGDWLLGEQWMTLVQPKIPQLINVRNLARAPAETRRAAFCAYDFNIIFYRQGSLESLQMGHSLLEEHTKHFGTSMI